MSTVLRGVMTVRNLKKIIFSGAFFLAITSISLAQGLLPALEIQPGVIVEVGEEVYFSASGTDYPDSAMLEKARYEWDFGDGYYHRFDPVVTTTTRSGIAVVHYYMKPGDFTVTLKVSVWAQWNADGTPVGEPIAVETTRQTVHVTGEAPMPGFEIQRAPFNNRLAQYLYVQIPEAYRANNTRLKVMLEGAKGSSSVLFSKTSLDSEEKLLLDQKSLVQDDYIVIAELIDAAGQRIAGGLWRDKFSKRYTGFPKVGIDENNSFRINGDLFFPIGPFMTNVTSFEEFVNKASINALQTIGWYKTQTAITWGDYLDNASTFNLKARGPGRGDYYVPSEYWGPSAANRWKFNHNIERMVEYVQLNKDKSSMFAWVWQDEPNLGARWEKVYPATLGAWAYVNHREDPHHPSYNLFYGYDWSKYYGTNPKSYDYLASAEQFGGKKWIQDIFAFDIYPLSYRLHPSLNLVDIGPHAVYLDALDRMNENNKQLVPIIPTLQPNPEKPQEKVLLVSSEQVYFQAWANVIHGAKGILWFPLFDYANIRYDAMKKFADQMKILGPAVLQAEPARSVIDSANVPLYRVDTMIREYNGSIYIFTARVTEPEPITEKTYSDLGLPVGAVSKYTGIEPESITVKFNVSGMEGKAMVEVVGEERIVEISDGQFTDTFVKNGVHIYKISNGISSKGEPTNLRITE